MDLHHILNPSLYPPSQTSQRQHSVVDLPQPTGEEDAFVTAQSASSNSESRLLDDKYEQLKNAEQKSHDFQNSSENGKSPASNADFYGQANTHTQPDLNNAASLDVSLHGAIDRPREAATSNYSTKKGIGIASDVKARSELNEQLGYGSIPTCFPTSLAFSYKNYVEFCMNYEPEERILVANALVNTLLRHYFPKPQYDWQPLPFQEVPLIKTLSTYGTKYWIVTIKRDGADEIALVLAISTTPSFHRRRERTVPSTLFLTEHASDVLKNFRQGHVVLFAGTFKPTRPSMEFYALDSMLDRKLVPWMGQIGNEAAFDKNMISLEVDQAVYIDNMFKAMKRSIAARGTDGIETSVGRPLVIKSQENTAPDHIPARGLQATSGMLSARSMSIYSDQNADTGTKNIRESRIRYPTLKLKEALETQGLNKALPHRSTHVKGAPMPTVLSAQPNEKTKSSQNVRLNKSKHAIDKENDTLLGNERSAVAKRLEQTPNFTPQKNDTALFIMDAHHTVDQDELGL